MTGKYKGPLREIRGGPRSLLLSSITNPYVLFVNLHAFHHPMTFLRFVQVLP
jgi:hypothetical protein